MDKSDSAYKTIGEVAKILNLKSNNKGVLPTHVIRFWETQFKQIKPKILNSNRRYYDEKTINLLKKVKFLLKDQGMTINGVKKILNNQEPLKLDESLNHSIKAKNFKKKLNKISEIIKEIKNLYKKGGIYNIAQKLIRIEQSWLENQNHIDNHNETRKEQKPYNQLDIEYKVDIDALVEKMEQDHQF